MSAILETINAAGRAFVDFALPMLVQSTVLILILLVVDMVLRKRVRAVFRYWIWMLVLIKLVLPPSLWSPVSVGTWFGDELQISADALFEGDEPAAEPPSTAVRILSQPVPPPMEPIAGAPERRAAIAEPLVAPAAPGGDGAIEPDTASAPAEADQPGLAPAAPVTALDWRGFTLLAWGAVVTALLLLLVQRAVFVRGLVAQAAEASDSMQNVLDECRARIGRGAALKISPNATSPAVCGLVRPVILIPRNLAPKISRHDLHAVLLHELAHVKRGDLWISLAQTLLQIVYFYNPLLWLANAVIRRVREQAVDESVLVAMGESAGDYPESLVNVAKLAFKRRPVLSLRLIGVVESKSALTARIKHILNRPLPKSAKLGVAGLVAVAMVAALLLPMARANREQTSEAASRFAVLPNCGVWTSDIDGHDLSLLDLASERVIELPAVKNEHALLSTTKASGRGDILYYYDRAKERAKITFLRSAGLHGEPVSDEYETLTTTPMQMPFETTLTTQGGHEFTIRIVRTDAQACYIQFGPLGEVTGAGKAEKPNGRSFTDAQASAFASLQIDPHHKETLRVSYWWEGLDLDSRAKMALQSSWPSGMDIEFVTELKNGRRVKDFVAANIVYPSKDEKSVRRILTLASDDIGAATAELFQRLDELKNSKAVMNGFYTDNLPTFFAVLSDGLVSAAAHLDRRGDSAEAEQKLSLIRMTRAHAQDVEIEYWQGVPPRDTTAVDESGPLPLTDRADKVMELAEEEARVLNHSYVGTEHILVALARDSEAVSARVLANLGVDVETLRAEMARLVKPGSNPPPSGNLPRTARAKRVMKYAEEQARSLGHDYVGTEHILRGLMCERHGVGARMLANLGLTLPRAKVELRKFVRRSSEEDVDADNAVRTPGSEPPTSRFTAELPNGLMVEFEDVSLRPGHETNVNVRVEPGRSGDASSLGSDANEPGGPLAFRVAGSYGDVRDAVVEQYERSLLGGRRTPGGDYAWFEVRPNVTLSPHLVTREHEGKTFLLLRTGAPDVMRADDGWALERVEATTDAMDRPAVGLWLDSEGAERLHAVTQANVKKALAILVAGKVVSAPMIMAPVRRAVVIVGNYTEQEVRQMIDILRAGMIEQHAAPAMAVSGKLSAGDPKDKPEPAPDVLANLRQLALGVVLFTHDHEGDLPATLAAIESYVPDRQQFAWMRANVTYVGRGNVKREAKPYAIPIAYKKTPEPAGGRYVAFMDGHAVLVPAERCKELGIEPVELGLHVTGDSGSSTSQTINTGISGRVVDPNGVPVPGVQVGVCTEEIGVTVLDGTLSQPRHSDVEKGQIVQADAQGRFWFEGEAPADFSLIAAHDDGFALIGLDDFKKSREFRLARWGRIEGQLASGRTALGNQISMSGLPNSTWYKHKYDFRYETKCDDDGRFAFERVPAGRFEVGYLASTGRGSASLTSRTPVVVEPGRTATMMKLGGEGRPVIGKLVPPEGYHGPIHFGQGLRALSTSRSEEPRPDNYDRMTRREQQAWHSKWRDTPEAKAFYEAMWSNPNWRHYCFEVQEDGSFRIEDVIPGTYRLTIWLEERFTGQGRPEEIGTYNGTVEVPLMAESSTNEPLDLGELTLSMKNPLHVGDTAPAFEAKTLDGKAIGLADYRGRHVLLSFWSPTFHPELDRLKALYADCGKTGQLQIIGLGGTDTLDEVTSYINEHDIPWPQVYFGPDWTADLFKKLGGQMQIILIDPEGKIVATWLRGNKLTDTVREAVAFAWQRTDRYVAPDPDGFFPDDAEAGQRLDALFKAVDKDRRSDEEILSTVRQGLRRTKEYRTNILRWIGNRYVWGEDPQNAEAIEIMYHAVAMERHYAIYFGLSVVKDKTPNILRTLAEICMQGEDVGRITWGVGAQRDELVAYIKPYLDDPDPQKRETASALVQHFAGKLDFDRHKEEERLERAKVEFAEQLPQFKQTLLTGDSRARREVLTTIQREGLAALLDDSFVPAFQACGADRDRKVRNEVARMAGGRWVWGAQEQDPNAVALMLKLASDEVRDVRTDAVYYGLSVVRDKTEPVIRRLVELALSDHENNLYGRIVWGLKGPMRAAPEPFEKVLAEYLDASRSNDHLAASVYLLYRDVLQKEPPAEWNLARIKQQYREDLFTIVFSAKEPFAPANSDALWNEFAKTLPEEAAAKRLPSFRRGKPFVCVAQARSKQQADFVRQSIEDNPRLSFGQVRPVPLWRQLYEEEKRGISSFPYTDETLAALTAPSAAAPGPIQQRIDAAAPGDTLRLEPGVYQESLIINKPLTLEGAGWNKTVILKVKPVVQSFEDIQRMMLQRLSKAESDVQREQMAAQLKEELAERLSPTALRVENAQDVVIRGVKFTSPGGHIEGTSMNLPIVAFDRSGVRFEDCAVIGGPGDGIHILNAADAKIERTLVAAMWGTGVVVGGKPGTPSRMHLQDCDVRNCHYAGVRIAKGSNDARIERCRISGAAWHGIRYDSASPRVVNNLIFGNARSGIYASGETAAVVSGNLFYANEMCGISCWFQNADTIEGNTFVENKRSALEILGASAPAVRRNIFCSHPTGVFLGNIGSESRFAQSDGTVALDTNLFWANERNVAWRRDADTTETIAPGQETHTLQIDPQFAAAATKDFSLVAGSAARQRDIGVADPIPLASPWPLQPEERAIIPDGETRDSRQWRHTNY